MCAELTRVALVLCMLLASTSGCGSGGSASRLAGDGGPTTGPSTADGGSTSMPPADGGPTTPTPADGGPPTPPAATASDPVTTPMTGSHVTYDVGPGKPYEEPDTVPWGALTAGDVVNLYHRPTPYRWKLCVRGKGTAQQPIVINGATDAAGQRPRLDFNGARTASGCNPGGGADVFDTASQWSIEDYAGIMIKAGVNDPYGYKPSWIQIRNLELSGAAPGNSFVNLAGRTVPYSAAPAGIWIQPSADILLENNVIYDHAFGVFTMAKDDVLDGACERITVRSNRIYGNGKVGSYREHNLYIQCTNPIIEGNYFGITRAGSQGSSYKSRSSGEVFRYNYVEASIRAIDWVEAEEQRDGIAQRPDYGVDYAYGNVVVNDCDLGNCASNAIHYGGDNLGEQEDTTELFTPAGPYRARLFFYNNTLVNRVDPNESWRVAAFDLSLRGTTVEAWNNLFFFDGTSNFSWLERAGVLRLSGTNLAFGAAVADARDTALAVNYTVSRLGTLAAGDPLFAAASSYDFRPGPGSGAIDAATGVPAGVGPDPAYAEVPVSREPAAPAKNGISPRTQRGAALDLGALEAGP
jgi:hypothetical protein